MAVTGLSLIEATEPPAMRPNEWASVGMGLLKMSGFVPEGPVMWQFERKDAADGYGPGWHNYQPDPKSGVDSVRIVEQLYQQHRHWGGGKTGTRVVQSGKFAYSLTFVAGAGQRYGEQTNTQTNVRRAVRRVPLAQACTCRACTQPRPSPRPSSAPPTPRFPAQAAPRAVPPPPPPPAVPAQGAAPAGRFEQELKALLAPGDGDNSLPRCWSEQAGSVSLFDVPASTAEFKNVKGHLLATLNAGGDVRVEKVTRVQNPAVYRAFRRDGGESIMFHGCKSQENEASIVKNGFRVDQCRSGGNNYGTWFAYISSYSDGGFAFDDVNGWRHLFVCLVSRHGLKRDDQRMRVVGQGGAYPQWIISYRHARNRF